VNTSKYDQETRKNIKSGQRTLAYRELQRRVAEERTQLEAKLKARGEAIERLKQRLIDVGITTDEVAKLAA